jgi:hypothetical protein
MSSPISIRHRARLWPLAVVLIGLLTALAIAALAAVSTLGAARGDMRAARADIERGRSQATAGEVAEAAMAFSSAADAASSAAEKARSPQVRLLGSVPVVAAVIDSVVATTTAAELSAQAGEDLLRAVADLPGGLDAISLGGGGQEGWLESAASLQAPITEAVTRLELAHRLVASAPADTVVAEVDEGRAVLEAELAQVVPVAQRMSALVAALPGLFGEDAPKRYFLGAQNPAELRGTGGLIGAYAILTVDDGRITISPFRPVQDLEQDIFTEETAPSDEFYTRYASFLRGPGTWLNVNHSPHFPSVAETIEAMYEQSEGQRLDGTVLVDPVVLREMLRATGPVTSPDPDVGTLEAETVVEYIVNRAPIELGVGGERKQLLGEAARVVLGQFLGPSVPSRRRLSVLAGVAGSGHLLVHAAAPELQRSLERLGVAGGLAPPDDTMAVFLSIVNTAESKADYWLERSAHADIALNQDGSAMALFTVTLTNNAPLDPSLPLYIIGPGSQSDLTRGESAPLVSLHCSASCGAQYATYVDPTGFGTWVGSEAGHTVLSALPRVSPGQSVTVRFSMYVEEAWQRHGNAGSATLMLAGAPALAEHAWSTRVYPPSGWALQSERATAMGQSTRYEFVLTQ